MSHEIETYGDKAAYIGAREDAWHRLGTTLPDCFTAEDALVKGYLGGWNIRKVPLTATEITDDGVTTVEVPDKFATVRTNPFTGGVDALGVVGNRYTPIQNEEHCAFLNALVDDSGAVFDTAGSLRGGREVFVTMRLPETMMVGGSDRVDLNIAALNSHDGTGAFRVLVTPVRVVCANTQAAAMGDNLGVYSIRHTRNAKAAVQAARETLDLTFRWVEDFQAEAERMLNTAMTNAEFDRIIGQAWGPKKGMTERETRNAEALMSDIRGLWLHSPTADGIRGTRWGAYQAVTEYADHFVKVRKGDSTEAERRALNTITDQTLAGTKRGAFELLRVGR